jgi:hypothetical protein
LNPGQGEILLFIGCVAWINIDMGMFFTDNVLFGETNLAFLHILILRLIGYTGSYTDYSTYGYPFLEM